MLCVFYRFVFAVLASLIPKGQGNCRNLEFTSFPKPGYRLENHTVRTVEVFDEDICMLECYLEPNCVSYNFHELKKESNTYTCDLNNSTAEHDKELVESKNHTYRGAENACAKNPCKNNATCQAGFADRDYQCLCVPKSGFEGHDCDEGFTAVFTTLGASGHQGPDSIGNTYSGQYHDGQVTLSSGIQLWTVPHTGHYRIEAIGASGGYGEDSVIKNGGRGAKMIGNFIFTKDDIIRILVGQKGKRGNANPKTAGGGGGTFVVRGSNTPLIIAGGGGGIKKMTEQHPGCDASMNTTGNAGYNSPLESGGTDGNGGNISGQYSGGGGGGFFSDGQNETTPGVGGGKGGKGYIQRGVGGVGRGGFGGGGGLLGDNKGAGGGGGYSGGSGGANAEFSCGGGGGSFNNGTNQQNECCYNGDDHGRVNITFIQ